LKLFSHTSKRIAHAATAMILAAGAFFTPIGSALPKASAQLLEMVQVEGFESTASLYPSSARANSVKLDLLSRPEPVKIGFHAVTLAYDFTGTIGTSAAYLNFRDPNGTVGRTLQGYPKKVGVWVYGDGNNHWLRAQFQDAAGTKAPADFTSSNGLNWTGWKYVAVGVPTGLTPPIKLNHIYLVETKDNNKNSGTLYFDQLSAFYTDSPVYGLDVEGLPFLQAGTIGQARVYATYQGSTEPVDLTSGVTFSSSNPAVATVDNTGRIQALEPGSATITASYNGAATGSYGLTVSREAVAPSRLELEAPVKLEAGLGGAVKTFAVYEEAAEPVAVRDGASYSSSAPGVVSVDSPSGILQALTPGSATISSTFQGVTAQHPMTVLKPVPVLQSIELKGLRAMTLGESLKAQVLGTYTWLPEPVELTSGVIFKSSQPGVASVDETGTVTALQVGTTRITAVMGTKSADFFLVVNKPAAAPKRELRAAWIATVDNVDWPKKGVTDAETQKRDFIAMLDELEAAGMNAVIVQVKPTSDAFYPSQYGPWSEWLTGVQGKDPGYNPLAFMLEEVHKRNMEFHAWFNPYRISLQADPGKLVPEHPARQNPDWVVSYGGKLYYNPGLPEAQKFIKDSIMEVVKQYDIDAVHFDDYFYPYPVSGVDFPDEAAYQTYGSSFPDKGDWRRHNVDAFIETISQEIKGEKSHVKFGISPFGIWRNKSQDAAGSDTNGLSSYDAIFADSKKWVEEEWIDYITPQIYWYMGYSPAAYDKLAEWWSGTVRGKNVHLYSGQAPYRIGSADPAWLNPEEMPVQIAYNRNFPEMKGSMFFSTKSLLNNPLGFTDRLKNDIYRYPALVPVMPWLDQVAPAVPKERRAIRKASGVEVTWSAGSGEENTAYYVVYRFEGEGTGSKEEAASIVGTVRKAPGDMQRFVDHTGTEGRTYTYAVTAVDRLHNESALSGGMTVVNAPDAQAPVTGSTLQGEQRNGWFVSEVLVALQASDDRSGVEATLYSLNGGAEWTAYTAPFPLQEEGVHTVLYRSTDGAGNVEEVQTATVSIDRSAPTVTLTGTDRVYSVDQIVEISCTAEDTVSGVVYSPCAAPLIYKPAYQLELGTHTVQAEAQDAAGHTGTAQGTFTVTVTLQSLATLTASWVQQAAGNEGIANSLLKKLEKGQLQAYIQELSALQGKKLESDKTELLIRYAEALR